MMSLKKKYDRPFALVICNGNPPSQRVAAQCTSGRPFIVCADGGANVAMRLGIRPDVIIGDCDSVLPQTRTKFARVPLVQIDEQESTDLEKALDYLLKKKFRWATVLGATGKRTDHAFANLSILAKYQKRLNIRFIDDDGEIFPLPRRSTLIVARDTTISLLPLGRCGGITTRGLKYPLRNETLEPGVREGVSNEAIEETVQINYRTGHLLIFVRTKKRRRC
ncbi:MAG: thiamine diphosphokinase [Ignavibacteriales bacterium]|nr:thiamine diphosphokinase [Ignavibacteriales bacterium]